MKVLLTLAVAVAFLTLFAVTFASDCQMKGHQFNVGEFYNPRGFCFSMRCDKDNTITVLPCANITGGPECTYKQWDLSKEYPECCPRWEC